jgi:hypothetical protein
MVSDPKQEAPHKEVGLMELHSQPDLFECGDVSAHLETNRSGFAAGRDATRTDQ